MDGILVIAAADLQQLFDACIESGWRIIAPTVRDSTVILDDVCKIDELPIGLWDEQDAGSYRLGSAPVSCYFGCTISAQAWKSFVYPARQKIWSARKQGQSWTYTSEIGDTQKLALIGVRGCDLHALAIQHHVREKHGIIAATRPLIVTVDCARAVSTCFCDAMGTGPAGTGPGVDLRLAEIFRPDGKHIFAIQVVSERGREIIKRVKTSSYDLLVWQQMEKQLKEVVASQQRTMDTQDLPAILADRSDDPYWDEIAQRCLSCANCTMVCPTCFCNSVEDTTDIKGEHTERWLRWDSCFSLDFSYVHPKNVRQSTKARYRQWLTHKLGYWVEQFGSSGCVGCGRCITWCPVGIDLTQAVAKLRQSGRSEENSAKSSELSCKDHDVSSLQAH